MLLREKMTATLLAVFGILILQDLFFAEKCMGISKNILTMNDCIKCHQIVFEELKEGKSKHETKTSCIDCHTGDHLPKSHKGDMIPECSKCHSNKPHFELANCTNCHHLPHQPNKIILEGEGQKDTCGTCHPDLVTEINTHITSHTGFACSFCHKKHRDRPNCLTCHDSHMGGQVFEDCIKCHQAHQPLTLQYNPKEIANNDCGACHPEIQKTLETGPTKHAGFKCVFCHADKHGLIPHCIRCHEKPHDRKMIQSFASCNDCHQSAHDILI